MDVGNVGEVFAFSGGGESVFEGGEVDTAGEWVDHVDDFHVFVVGYGEEG